MAERKLNINAPLLSVRRFSMKSSTPREEDERVFGNSTPKRGRNVNSDKSDFTLDQVTEPVAVPFQWEKIPGRRKDGNEPEPEQVEKASVTPRLPPGRVLDAARKPLGNELNEQYEDRYKYFRALSVTDDVTKFESFKDDKDKEGADLGKDGDDEDDVSDYYSDALDTLTMTESFSMTCSVSGLSGAEVKPSGSFSTDAQTRDFMMSRFLPAAKAMTLQPAQYASKKQPMAPQEQRQDKMVVAVRRPPSPNKYLPVPIPHYSQEEEDGGESDDREQEQEHYDSASISAKGCGLFPRLCLKNSLCLLNPLPGMKIRTKALMPPKSEIERPVKAASFQSHTPTLKKDVLYKHKSGELPKLTQKNVYKHKSGELPKLTQKVTGVSKRFSYSGNLETMGRLSPSRRSGGISPYRREAPQSPFRGTGFLGVPKEVESFKSNPLNSIKKGSSVDQKVLSHQRTRQGSGSGSGSGTPTVEKTLYVDTVSTAEILCSKSSFSDSKEQLSSADLDSEFSFQDIKCLDIVKGVSTLHPRLSGSADVDQSTFSDTSLPKDEAGMLKVLSMVEGLNQATKMLECTKPNDGENQRISDDHQTPKVEDLAIVKVGDADSPLPPPLPKSPSESWLWRTLPSVNVQNSHLRTQFLKRKKDIIKPSTPNTKWETIVKTSNPRHDHARYSQELIVHPSQPHKT